MMTKRRIGSTVAAMLMTANAHQQSGRLKHWTPSSSSLPSLTTKPLQPVPPCAHPACIRVLFELWGVPSSVPLYTVTMYGSAVLLTPSLCTAALLPPSPPPLLLHPWPSSYLHQSFELRRVPRLGTLHRVLQQMLAGHELWIDCVL